MLDRAWSELTIKSLDEDQRIIEGFISTPDTDRVGDIVEPKGARFKLPMPLLWQHKRDHPIGQIIAAEVSDAGIWIRAQVAKIQDAGTFKDMVDYAWSAIKNRLVPGLSVGIKARPGGAVRIGSTGGVHYKEWDWFEGSTVTIASNGMASIAVIKSVDQEFLAASGLSPRARGTVKLIKPQAPEGTVNVQEQIKGFEATLAAKQAAMAAIMEKSAASGETLDLEQEQQYDALKGEVMKLNAHLVRLADHEKMLVTKARVIDAAPPKIVAPTGVVVKGPVDLPQGVRFARVARCIGVAYQRHRDVETVAKDLYPDDMIVQKAAVAAGSTTGTTWGHDLVGDETRAFADFVEFLRPQTILGKFGTNGIPDLRRVPFRTRLVSQTTGGEGYWVGEGKPKPLTKFDVAATTLEPLKVANIAVITNELLRDSSPSAEILVRDELAAALRERLDEDFIDPDKAAVAGVSPASITNGITPVPSGGGTDADAVRADLRLLFNEFIEANNPPTSGVFIMSARRALAVGLMRNGLGQSEFNNIGMGGGTLEGIPVIVSEYVGGDDTYGDIVVLVNARDIYLGDEGGIEIDVSREASVQMDDAPATQNALTGTGVSLVSLWQTNSVGFRAERAINWARRRSSAVAYMEDVLWGTA